MKKIIFLLTLVLAITVNSGSKLPVQDEMAEKNAKPAALKDTKSINKPDATGSKTELQSNAKEKATQSTPGILFLISKDNGQASWTPSLWWSYKHSTAGQPGC
jgi:hypothetical protein